MADKRRLNLSFSMASPLQREAWEIICAVPKGQRTEAVCRMLCKGHDREDLLNAIRSLLREELGRMTFVSKTEKTEQPQAGDVDDSVLGFLLALQNDGGEE